MTDAEDSTTPEISSSSDPVSDPESHPVPDDEIGRLRRQFNRVAGRARLALFWERAWPRLLPPLTVGAAFAGASFFGLWPLLGAVSPVLQFGGVAAFAGAALASPFLARTKSLLVKKKDALQRLDERTGDPTRPAQTLADHLGESSPPVQKHLWNRHLAKMWAQWGGKFRAGRPEPDISRRSYALAGVFALSAIAGGFFGTGRLTDAFHHVAPPAPPVAPRPPMHVKAWIAPPDGIAARVHSFDSRRKYKEKDKEKDKEETQAAWQNGLDVHEQSVLTLLVYGDAPVRLNDSVVSPDDVITEQDEGTITAVRQYKISLQPGPQMLRIEGGPSWQFAVNDDTAPEAELHEVTRPEKSPKNLEIGYTLRDDHGIAAGTIRIKPAKPAAPEAQPLPASEIPEIPLP